MRTSIKTGLQLTPVVISCLLMGAHFLRSGHIFVTAFCVLFIGVLFIRRPMAARAVQVGLVLAAGEWVYTTFVLASSRGPGEPWVRLVVILGAVTLFTLGAACMFFLRTLKGRYGLN